MEECLDALKSTISCRDKEISTLYSLISSQTSMPQSIFALGHSGTGKSLVIQSVLNYLNYDFAIVNCIENPSIKHLLERILVILWNQTEFIEKAPKCANLYEFVIELKKFTKTNNGRNIVLVFEDCHRLRDLDPTFLSGLLCLRELSKVNVCTIFISDITWEKFKIKNDMTDPIKINFPQYTQEEIQQILMLLKNHEDPDFYERYLQLFLSVYYRFCRDLHELHYIAEMNFEKYIEPIQLGKCKKTDCSTLWHNISPVFKANLEVIYLRISANELEQDKFLKKIDSTFELVKSFELPFYSKYMLVAAFLASYIPPKYDRHLFCKHSSRKKKRAKSVVKKNSFLTALPRSFTLDRMLCIFCFISNEDVDVNAILLSQISTMCRLGLITPVGLSRLDEPKYKCCVDYQFVATIAKNIECDIKFYFNALMS